MIIVTLARLTAEAYQQGKKTNKYILLDEEFVKPLIKNI
jgi:hypothetical protein